MQHTLTQIALMGAEWTRHRALMMRPFHFSQLQGMIDTMSIVGARMAKCLQSQPMHTVFSTSQSALFYILYLVITITIATEQCRAYSRAAHRHPPNHQGSYHGCDWPDRLQL